MGKIKLLLLLVFFVGQFAFAQCGSTITGGAGSSQQTNTNSPCSSNSNLGAFAGGGSVPNTTINYGPGYAEAMAAKAKADECAKEKGNIEKEFAGCMSETAKDFAREVGNCNSLSNTEWSLSGGGEYKFLFGSITYTIQNPNYEKCFNTVSSYQNMGEKLCAERKTNQEAVARSWNKGQCADFYK